jgi:hypothetical protein
LLAHAFLSVLAATQPDDGHTHQDQLIPLTRNEIRRLFTGLRRPAARTQPAAGLVTMATPAPIHRTRLPLPAAGPYARMITKVSLEY